MERLLEPLRDDPLPPSRVDVGSAIRTARRRARVRWGMAAVGVVAIVIAGAAVPRALTVGPAPPVPVAVTPDRPAPSVGDGDFDPMRHVITVGEVDDLRVDQVATARRWQSVRLVDGKGLMIGITVHAHGRPAVLPLTGPFDPSAGSAAEPVRGRPAYWMAQPEPMFQAIVWQWRDDGWASASVVSGGGADPLAPDQLRQLLHRAAEAVAVGAGVAVTVPFTMAGAPVGYGLVGTTIMRGTRTGGVPFVRCTLLFAAGVDSDAPGGGEPGATIAVTADSGVELADQPGSVNRTVDGRPASVYDSTVVLHAMGDGFAVEVTGGAGGEALLAVARTVRIIAGARDESTWTARPLG